MYEKLVPNRRSCPKMSWVCGQAQVYLIRSSYEPSSNALLLVQMLVSWWILWYLQCAKFLEQFLIFKNCSKSHPQLAFSSFNHIRSIINQNLVTSVTSCLSYENLAWLIYSVACRVSVSISIESITFNTFQHFFPLVNLFPEILDVAWQL